MSLPSHPTDYMIISQHENCEVKQNKENQQHGLFANASFKNGDVIVAFNASKIVDTPNYLTVQVSEHKHIHLFPEYLQYVNHCCEPNVFFNTTTMQLECDFPVPPNDKLPTPIKGTLNRTEWRYFLSYIQFLKETIQP